MAEDTAGQQTPPASGTGNGGAPGTGSISTVAAGAQHTFDFTFRFDTEQLEVAWQDVAQKVEASVTVTDEQDPALEAAYWDQLEKWILKGSQHQASASPFTSPDFSS